MSAAVGILAGAVCGVLSGFGIGGGSLLMVFMTAVLGMAQPRAQGINLLYFLPTAGTALFIHFKNRQICKNALLPTVLGGCLAAAAGAILAAALDPSLLRRVFGLFLLAVGVRELMQRKKP